MERRLAVICSHLRQVEPVRRPIPLPSPVPFSGPSVSPSHCEGSSGEVPKGGYDSTCVFCRIVRGESPAFKLYEDDICACILDSHPLSPGHSLIIPKSHYSSLEVTPPLVIAGMCSTVPLLSKAIMRATQCDSFNLLVNSGAASGQVIFHTHLHIIPRRGDDKLWTSERSFRRKCLKPNQETAALSRRIQELLSFPIKNGDSCETQESKLDENS